MTTARRNPPMPAQQMRQQQPVAPVALLQARDLLLEALRHDSTRRLAWVIAQTVITVALEEPGPTAEAEHVVASYVDLDHVPGWQGMVADIQALGEGHP